jgi:SecDF, P1 head subdomain
MSDTRFERDLRETLLRLAPEDVPASLRAAIAEVPQHRPQGPRTATGMPRGRSLVAGLSAVATVAAAVVLAVVIIGHPFGLGGDGGIGQPSPTTTPTVSPTAAPLLRVEYQVLPVDGRQPSPGDLAAIATIVTDRLRASGIAAPDVATAPPNRLVVMVPSDRADQLRALIGTTGQVDFVPLGQVEVQEGQALDLTRYPPLFSGDAVASVSVGEDQSGLQTADLVLAPDATSLFAAYTADHVGDSFAIVLDGNVISAPVIREAISDGRVTISLAGVGGSGPDATNDLAAILESGSLPFPLQEVDSGP